MDVNKISRREYDSGIKNLKEFSSYGFKDSGGSHFNNTIKYNSESYCAVVLEAYENGIITGGEFYKFTNLSKKFIPDLQKRIYGVEQ